MTDHDQKPLAVRAHALVAQAVKRGELDPVDWCLCVDCGEPAQVYDHRDYTKPLVVSPVCHRCNARRGPAFPYKRRSKGRAPAQWLPLSQPR